MTSLFDLIRYSVDGSFWRFLGIWFLLALLIQGGVAFIKTIIEFFKK